MKIHSDKPELLTGGTTPPARTADPAAAAAKAAAGSTSADQLTLSPEARALQAAADSASAPIRQDIVDRMRALLDKGAIGEDAPKLADAIIDDWIERS